MVVILTIRTRTLFQMLWLFALLVDGFVAREGYLCNFVDCEKATLSEQLSYLYFLSMELGESVDRSS